MTEMENSDKNDVPTERCTAPDSSALPSTTVEDHLEPLYSVEVESTPCDWLATSQILLEESNIDPYNEVLLQVSEDCQANEDEEIIEKLLDRGFSHFTSSEKLEIIKCRPTPSLRLHCAHKYKTARNFHVRWYDKFKWLCGSAKKDKLYCWPCLLFSKVRYHKNWNELGQNNLTNIHTSFRQHENSKSHMFAYMKMLKFKRIKYEFRMDAPVPLCEIISNADSYNEIVKKNRYIIKCLVDTICSDRLESLLRLDNCNNCAQLLSELAKSDCKLRDYLNSTNILVNLTDTILCDIITSISKAIFVKIKYELEDTRYCALFIERMVDKNENVYLIIICRFINKLRVVQHRLITFLEVNKYPYSNDLLQAFLEIIHDLGCCEKLMSIAYDRNLFNRDFTNQFEIEIRKLCRHVLLIDFTPPNAAINVFNSIQSTEAGKLFFIKLSGLTFLLTSSKDDRNLAENVERFLPDFNPNEWTYPKNVLSLAKQQSEILSLIEHITTNAEFYLSQTYLQALGLKVCLNELEFQLILDLSKTIYLQFENLMKTLIENEIELDISIYKQRLLNKKTKLFNKLEIHFQIEQLQLIQNPSFKLTQQKYYNIIDEFFDISMMHLPSTNKIYDQRLLSFSLLLDTKYFLSYSNNFPNDIFNILKNIFKKHFDFLRLKNELMVVYKTKDFYKENLIIFHDYLLYHSLMLAFPEVYKLTLLTITMFEDHSFIKALTCPIFADVKNYLEKTTTLNKFNNLLYLIIEKQLVNELWTKELLYNEVIEQLSQYDHILGLSYR